jgi:hypothetical protein
MSKATPVQRLFAKVYSSIMAYDWAPPAAAVGMLVAVLMLGHLSSKTPLERLGHRPMGRELWSWLLSFIKGDTGIWGYDSSLGAWSPPMRLALHASFIGIIYAASGVIDYIVVYLIFWFYFHDMVPNVSHPGGPRQAKIQRVPQFQDKDVVLDDKDIKAWRSVVAQESHKVTEGAFDGSKGAILTGEPAGRQIWTTHDDKKKSKRVDEKLVQELAAGGRTPRSFNAAKNPNG